MKNHRSFDVDLDDFLKIHNMELHQEPESTDIFLLNTSEILKLPDKNSCLVHDL